MEQGRALAANGRTANTIAANLPRARHGLVQTLHAAVTGRHNDRGMELKHRIRLQAG
jgi:hypothetical protein